MTTYVTILNGLKAVTTTAADADIAYVQHSVKVDHVLDETFGAPTYESYTAHVEVPFTTYIDGNLGYNGKFIIRYDWVEGTYHRDLLMEGYDYFVAE